MRTITEKQAAAESEGPSHTFQGLAIWRGDEYILNFFQDESNTYVGSYKVANVTVSFSMEGDKLVFIQDGEKKNIHFTSDTDFFMIETVNGEFLLSKTQIIKWRLFS